jgi:hypothetical protein
VRLYGYVTPELLLVGNVRREHLDMRDGGTEAGGSKQEGVGLRHTLSFYSTGGRQKVKRLDSRGQ